MATNTPAWTSVPENFSSLWKQRVRWIYGGLTVIAGAKNLKPIIQDVLGHVLFLTTGLLIVASFFLPTKLLGNGSANFIINIFHLIIYLTIFQLALWYLFQLWIMRLYEERDWKDWAIRLLLIPEFLYANLMTLVLLGSYVFFVFTLLRKRFLLENSQEMGLFRVGAKVFKKLGFTEKWGTRGLTETSVI